MTLEFEIDFDAMEIEAASAMTDLVFDLSLMDHEELDLTPIA